MIDLNPLECKIDPDFTGRTHNRHRRSHTHICKICVTVVLGETLSVGIKLTFDVDWTHCPKVAMGHVLKYRHALNSDVTNSFLRTLPGACQYLPCS